MKFIRIIALLFISVSLQSQDIYLSTFGDSTDHPIIYLHGGPGGTSLLFEHLVAPKLAEEGFFVIVYDRRGDGRSGRFEEQSKTLILDKLKVKRPNFRTSFEELDIIIEKFNLKKPTLLGHSFGGAVATLYADTFPNKVHAIILSGAPIDIQASYTHSLKASKEIYKQRKDSVKLSWIESIEEWDSYKGYILVDYLAFNSGYAPELHLNEEAQRIDSIVKVDSLKARMDHNVAGTFALHDPYDKINYLKIYSELKEQGIEIFGLYGKSDFRYPPFLIEELKNAIGTDHVLYLDQCGHSTLLHRRSTAIQKIKEWIK